MFTTKNEPNAAKLMDSLRYLGYDNYSAICDLVDNALDAEAKIIHINISQVGGDPVISIADDGYGMDERVLDEALKLGSLTDRNSTSDLGKYGMGLVTASLSIAKRTAVLTRSNGTLLKSVTDIDEIKKRNEFCKFLGKASPEDINQFARFIPKSTGTLVELTKCDNLKNQNLAVFRNTLRGKLGQIYRYFLLAGKKILLNGESIATRDPLMLDEKETEIFSDETFDIALKNLEGREITDRLRIRIVLLPDFGADGNRERKIGQRGQGFYILRNNREIAEGQRLDLFTRHNDLNRFRGEIFFSGIFDEFMGVNFTKREIDPHQAIRDKIENLVSGQIRTIRNRIKSSRVTSEDKDITHDESEKIISAKSHLLIRPKATKTDKPDDTTSKGTGEARGKKPNGTQGEAGSSSPRANVRFESVMLGASGPIYEAEQVGRLIVIQWNIDHPFYQRFILERKDDQTLRTSVDFLVYSLATAELTTLNDDNFETIQNIKSVMSSNLRSLLS
jgi:hypothetical protein